MLIALTEEMKNQERRKKAAETLRKLADLIEREDSPLLDLDYNIDGYRLAQGGTHCRLTLKWNDTRILAK